LLPGRAVVTGGGHDALAAMIKEEIIDRGGPDVVDVHDGED